MDKVFVALQIGLSGACRGRFIDGAPVGNSSDGQGLSLRVACRTVSCSDTGNVQATRKRSAMAELFLFISPAQSTGRIIH
jgi:hypothetical protein